jgi:hypothetical protein
MCYPLVERLTYRIACDEGHAIGEGALLEGAVGDFTFKLSGTVAEFIPIRHFASADGARGALEPLLRSWELDAAIAHGPDAFTFVFREASVRERPRQSGEIEGLAVMGFIVKGRLTGVFSEYPKPPREFVVDELTQALGVLFLQAKRTPVAALQLAYAMLTCVDAYFDKRTLVTKTFNISAGLLTKVQVFSSNRGEGAEVRKFSGTRVGEAVTSSERAWLFSVLELLVRRAGQLAAGVSIFEEANLATHPPPDDSGRSSML